MSSKIKVSAFFNPEKCTTPHGCYIKFISPTDDWQQFVQPNNYYFLADGDAVITYQANNALQTISTPYSDGWNDYVDNWNYSDNVKIRTTSTTKFAHVTAEDSSNNVIALNIKFGKVENNTISINANANSVLIVYGNNFMYNNNLVTSNTSGGQRFDIQTQQDVAINATSKCLCFLIETA